MSRLQKVYNYKNMQYSTAGNVDCNFGCRHVFEEHLHGDSAFFCRIRMQNCWCQVWFKNQISRSTRDHYFKLLWNDDANLSTTE